LAADCSPQRPAADFPGFAPNIHYIPGVAMASPDATREPTVLDDILARPFTNLEQQGPSDVDHHQPQG
jgi:hypothetical protein